MKKYLQEFREFAVKGNVIDLAVAVIVGGAFGKIVSSLVADILMPLVDSIFGGVSLENLKYVLQRAILNEDGSVLTPAVTINIGNFLQTIFDFLVIAIFIFIIIKIITQTKEKLKRKKEEEDEKEEEKKEESPSRQEEILTEIRDILKNKNNRE